MLRRLLLVFIISLLAISGCRKEQQATQSTPEEAVAEAPAAPPPPPAVRKILDKLEPSIPLWPGARATSESVRKEGSSTIIDLWTNDSFPMVWHYYVTYLAQYRAWEPLSPFPKRSEEPRSLDLVLSDVMKDPFVPGTALDRDDQTVTLMIREDPTRNRVNIRYLIQPAQAE